MDELTQLRSVRDDVDPVSDDTLARGREALLAVIAQDRSDVGSVRSTRRSRGVGQGGRRVGHRAGWIGAGSLAAAGVAAALVAGNVLGVAGPHGGAEPAAAAVLEDAALQAVHTSDPTVAPGQYLRVATRAVYAAAVADDDGISASYLVSQDGQMYLPSDLDQDWVWVRDPERPVRTFGAASERAAAADAAQPSTGEYLRAAKGAFYDGSAALSPTTLAALPRDPEALLNHIRAVTKGAGPSADAEALVWIADELRTGIVPADLRAAMFRAAAMVPGTTITDGAADLDGRTGVAIGHEMQDGDTQEIVIDPDTGLLIGEREVVRGSAATAWHVPDGTAIGWTSVTTSVVDAAPTNR